MKPKENQVITVLEEDSFKKITKQEKDEQVLIIKEFYQHSNSTVYFKLNNFPHHNVCEIFYVEKMEYGFKVCEEYLGNTTLDKIIGISDEDILFKIVNQVLDGVEHLHKLGIIHRDLKPENIYIIEERVVVNDFDISKNIKHQERKTRDTELLGTAGYASPEQYGFSESDERTDIYSLGVLINELYSGQHISEYIVEGPLSEIIRKCTLIDANDRYQNIDELREDFKRCSNKSSKYTLPGFRSNNNRNKITALILYALMVFIVLATEAEGAQSFKDHLESKILMALLLILTTIISTNYLNIKDLLPYKIRSKKVLSWIILWSIGFIIISFIFVVITSILNSML